MVQHEHPIDSDELIKESWRRRVHLESLPRLAALLTCDLNPTLLQQALPFPHPTDHCAGLVDTR